MLISSALRFLNGVFWGRERASFVTGDLIFIVSKERVSRNVHEIEMTRMAFRSKSIGMEPVYCVFPKHTTLGKIAANNQRVSDWSALRIIQIMSVGGYRLLVIYLFVC